jgi:hypothetical protein
MDQVSNIALLNSFSFPDLIMQRDITDVHLLVLQKCGGMKILAKDIVIYYELKEHKPQIFKSSGMLRCTDCELL